MNQPAMKLLSALVVLSVASPSPEPAPLQAGASAYAHHSSATSTSQGPMRVPFGTGERFMYDVRLGTLKVGSSALEVRGIETVRGRNTWHTVFWIKGGTFFYKVNDILESWFDIETFHSLRFVKQLEEGSADREQKYEIYPDRGHYVNERNDKPTRTLPTVKQPLDDGSFLYFVRTIPLTVGHAYDFSRYFIPDRNPVTIRVLRRERVTVPAGTFNAIVLQPVIKAKGIFSEEQRAEVWLSDDSTRMVLQIKSKFAWGSLSLFLKSYSLATAATP